MTNRVYTIGYSGMHPDELKSLAETLKADLFDIRFSPRSRDPRWAGSNVRALVNGAYQHVKALGNANYKSDGPVEIVDYESGKAAIQSNERPVILMCACKDPTHCHRTVVGKMLEADGFRVSEIQESAPPAPPKPPKPAQLKFF